MFNRTSLLRGIRGSILLNNAGLSSTLSWKFLILNNIFWLNYFRTNSCGVEVNRWVFKKDKGLDFFFFKHFYGMLPTDVVCPTTPDGVEKSGLVTVSMVVTKWRTSPSPCPLLSSPSPYKKSGKSRMGVRSGSK